METQRDEKISVQVSDVSGQKLRSVSGIPNDATVGELTQTLLSQMNLPRNDGEGRPLTYHTLNEREGRHLHASERVGEVVHEGDTLVLEPNIDAGRK